MLKGRLFLRYFLMIAYIGVTGGMILGLNMMLEERVMLGIVFFIIGIVGHFVKGNGYYVSLIFNSIGLGVLLPIVSEYFEIVIDPILLPMVSVACLILFIAFTYIASSTYKRNVGWNIHIFLVVGIYVLILFSLGAFDYDLLNLFFLLYHIGVIYMVALWIVGVRSEDLLHACSVASFILLLAAILIGIVALIAAAMGDSDNNSSSSSRSRNSSSSGRSSGLGYWLGYHAPYRGYRRRYYYHNYFLYDAYYWNRYGRRNDYYAKSAREQEEERLRKEEEERQKLLRQEELNEIY